MGSVQYESVDYHKLREIEREELESSALAKVPSDFYARANSLLNELKERAKENPALHYREYEGAERSLNKIISKRLEKIILSTSRGEVPKGMVGPEIELQQSISLAVLDFKEKIKEEKEQKEEKKSFLPENKRKVKILRYVDAYIGEDGKEYGPFSEGEEIIIEAKEAEWLVQHGMAEFIE